MTMSADEAVAESVESLRRIHSKLRVLGTVCKNLSAVLTLKATMRESESEHTCSSDYTVVDH